MSKKVLSLVLALVMVLGSFSFVSAAKYDDVTGTTYEEAVDRLSLLGILEGYPDGKFLPDGEITRAEFAAVAIRAKGLKATAEAAQGLPTGFTDVPGTFWASGIIGTAGKLGIVNGVGNGLFAPQAPVKYEEAITMLVRALGYEPSAQAKGGYPYGYLIVANEVGLLDAVKGTQGAPATRGQVAQMTDNALETEMMIQVGYGTDTKWVVSGTEDTTEKYLLDELGFDSVIGRPTSVNSNRKGITVTVEDEDEIKRLGKDKVSVTLPEGFDVYAIEGLESKIWYRDDIVIAKTLEEAKYDAFEYNEDDEELDLITEDESYEIAASKDLYSLTIDDNKFKDMKDGDVADYAKVVLNDDDEIIWAQGYTFDGFVVVDEVKEDVVYSADNYDEVDVEDFLIVKDGKEISVKDLEEGDVLYYNADEEFAVVYNNSKEGKIERVYADDKNDLRFAGKNYKIADGAIYLSEEGKIGELNTAALEEIEDEDEDVVIFFNFKNEVTVVLAGPEAGTSAYYVLRDNANVYSGRKGKMLALDVRDSAGAKVSFDLSQDFIDKDEDADFLIQDGDGGFYANEDNIDTLAGKLTKGLVLKVTLDKDGDAKEAALMTKFEVKDNDDIEVDDSKVKAKNGTDFKLQSNTVVFYDGLKEAIKLGEAEKEFSKVKNATFFVENGRVVAIVGATDADSKTITVSGLLESTSNITKLASGKYEFKIKVSGSTKRYVTEKDNLPANSFNNLKDGMIINLEIGEKSGEIKGTDGWSEATKHPITITSVNGKTIKGKDLDGRVKEYTLNNDGIVYDAKLKEIRLAQAEGKDATIYMEGNSSRFVNYVIVGRTVEDDDVTTEGTITHISTSGTGAGYTGTVIVDKKSTYFVDSKTVVVDKDGVVLFIGSANVTPDGYKGDTAALKVDDKIEVTAKDGLATEIKRLSTKVERNAIAALDEAKALASTKVKADYTAEAWKSLTDALALPERNHTEIVTKEARITAALDNLSDNMSDAAKLAEATDAVKAAEAELDKIKAALEADLSVGSRRAALQEAILAAQEKYDIADGKEGINAALRARLDDVEDAIEEAQDILNATNEVLAELDKVDDIELASDTELTEENVKSAVENDVDTNKVKVSVEKSGAKFKVTLTHKTETTVEFSKVITVTVAE